MCDEAGAGAFLVAFRPGGRKPDVVPGSGMEMLRLWGVCDPNADWGPSTPGDIPDPGSENPLEGPSQNQAEFPCPPTPTGAHSDNLISFEPQRISLPLKSHSVELNNK